MKILLFIYLFNCVAAKVLGGYRDGYFFRVNLVVHFTLTYVLPGETKKQTININGDKGFDAMEIVSKNVFKIRLNWRDFGVWFQATLHENDPVGFTFDSIQIIHKGKGNISNEKEIGTIQDSQRYKASFYDDENRKYVHLYGKPLDKYYGRFDIDIITLCVNFAYGYWNPIAESDDCYRTWHYGSKIPPPTTQPPPITTTQIKTKPRDQISTKSSQKLTTKPVPTDQTSITHSITINENTADIMKTKFPNQKINISHNQK